MWYVIQVITGEEKKTVDICRFIIKQGINHEFFVPETDRMKKYRGQWHKIRKPMFPGYVFISSDNIEEIYEELKRVPKLTKILQTDKTITPISEKEEQLIKNLTNEEHIAEMSVGYIEGAKLIVETGPLEGKEALVKKIDRHKRVAVLLVEMFGSSTEVTMGLEVLRKN